MNQGRLALYVLFMMVLMDAKKASTAGAHISFSIGDGGVKVSSGGNVKGSSIQLSNVEVNGETINANINLDSTTVASPAASATPFASKGAERAGRKSKDAETKKAHQGSCPSR